MGLTRIKYFLGGGFCYGVFEMSTKDLIGYYGQAINSIDNRDLESESYILGYVGGHCRHITNLLVGSILDTDGDPQSMFISHL